MARGFIRTATAIKVAHRMAMMSRTHAVSSGLRSFSGLPPFRSSTSSRSSFAGSLETPLDTLATLQASVFFTFLQILTLALVQVRLSLAALSVFVRRDCMLFCVMVPSPVLPPLRCSFI